MSGSGARDGYGSPPWDPADPMPGLDDTQAIPGLGSVPAPGESGGGPSWAGGSASRDRDQGADAGDDGDGGQGEGNGRGQGQQDDAAGGGHAKRPKRRRSFWREIPILIVVALLLALVIKSFVVQAFYIPSGSMQNTLEIGDRVLINKIVYHLRPIHRGDIVVFDGTGSWNFDNTPTSSNIFSKAWSELEGIVGISHDSAIYIKRVIGIPGDHVVCCNSKGQITVNGVALSESSYLYPGNAPSTQTFNITVPPGRLWVMGDHRAISYDSRGHMGDPGGGTIPESGVLGRAFVIIWPPSQWGFLNIPATFEQPALNASNADAGGSTAALESAMDNGTPIQEAGSAIPLGLGVAGAIPLTLLQRTARRRRKARRDKRRRVR